MKVDWSMDSDCAACHASEEDSRQSENCLASIHEKEGATCIECHSDSESLAKAHDDVDTSSKMPTKLKRTAVSSESCLACHEQAELTEKTIDLSLLTDKEGTTVNPHALPQTETHVDQVTCNSCHVMHSESDLEQNSIDTCIGCHHAEVYTCNTCH